MSDKMPNFERFLAIDWSGAKAPRSGGKIAVASCSSATAECELLAGPWSRSEIADMIGRIVRKSARNPDRRSLIGIDCNFGYARSIGVSQFGKDFSYKKLWPAVERICEQERDFYASEFWTHEDYSPFFWTAGPQPGNLTLAKRLTEHACQAQGYGAPESPFKLLGPKQVGKGGLAGMRMAQYLKNRYEHQIAFWPYERELAQSAPIVITEIYPRLFIRKAGLGGAKISQRAPLKQALDVYKTNMPSLGRDFSDHQSDALISAAGLRAICGPGPFLPDDISFPSALDDIHARSEGWIFGVA